MFTSSLKLAALVSTLAVTSLSQIQGCETDPTPTPSKYQWYATCGDPVCSGHDPQPGVPKCTTQQVGDACQVPGETCDPGSDCNQLLICTDTDPQTQPGGCPISRAAKKTDIHYLDSSQRDSFKNEILGLKLATYKYNQRGEGAPTHLGFIIDDTPGSLAVDRDRDMIDLYGYTSMTVAAVQSQHEEIEALKVQIAELKAAQARGCK